MTERGGNPVSLPFTSSLALPPLYPLLYREPMQRNPLQHTHPLLPCRRSGNWRSLPVTSASHRHCLPLPVPEWGDAGIRTEVTCTGASGLGRKACKQKQRFVYVQLGHFWFLALHGKRERERETERGLGGGAGRREGDREGEGGGERGRRERGGRERERARERGEREEGERERERGGGERGRRRGGGGGGGGEMVKGGGGDTRLAGLKARSLSPYPPWRERDRSCFEPSQPPRIILGETDRQTDRQTVKDRHLQFDNKSTHRKHIDKNNSNIQPKKPSEQNTSSVLNFKRPIAHPSPHFATSWRKDVVLNQRLEFANTYFFFLFFFEILFRAFESLCFVY